MSSPADLIGDLGKDGEMQANDAYYQLVKRIATRMMAKEEREAPARGSAISQDGSSPPENPETR